MSLYTSLRSELLKTKRTAPLYFTFAAAAFGPFMSMLDLVLDGVAEEHTKDIFNEMFTTKFMMPSIVVLPLFIILLCTLLPHMEYKNNTWKQVLISPQTKVNIFLAKYINIQLLIGVFLITDLLLTTISAVVLHITEPGLNVLNQPLDGYAIMMSRLSAYAALSGICAIQFWLGLVFRNFIIPIAIGIALWFIGSILVLELQSDFVAYFPYSFHAYGKLPKYDPLFNEAGLTSIVYAVIFLTAGFLGFRKRRLNP